MSVDDEKRISDIADLLRKSFSHLYLSNDVWLMNMLPLIRIENLLPRLSSLTVDTAEIAFTIETRLFDILTVSRDLEFVSLVDDKQDLNINDQRTFYIENLPKRYTEDSLKAYIQAKLKSIEISNLHLPLINSFYNAHHHSNKLSTPTTTAPYDGLPQYAFLLLKSPEDVDAAFQLLNTYIPVKKRNIDALCVNRHDDDWGLRLLTKGEWLERSSQYLLLQERLNSQKSNPLKLPHKRKVDSIVVLDESTGRTWEKGLLVEFTGVDAKTDRNTLNKLFSAISPLNYVDYESGSTTGIMRFKTNLGANNAISYFSKNKIHQRNPFDDCGSLVSSARGSSCIKLFLLQGEKERKYWKNIRRMHRKKAIKIQEEEEQAEIQKKKESWYKNKQKIELNNCEEHGSEEKKGHVRF